VFRTEKIEIAHAISWRHRRSVSRAVRTHRPDEHLTGSHLESSHLERIVADFVDHYNDIGLID
jgi:hypothetical protein